MVKASIKLSCSDCGTEFWAEKKCHNRSESDNWEQWVAQNGRQCPECYAKTIREAREAARAKKSFDLAEKAICPLEMPSLEGTEKQIKWATDLRNSVIVQLNNKKFKWDILQAMATGPEETEEHMFAKTFLAELKNPSAHWWIENRGSRTCGGAATIEVL